MGVEAKGVAERDITCGYLGYSVGERAVWLQLVTSKGSCGGGVGVGESFFLVSERSFP